LDREVPCGKARCGPTNARTKNTLIIFLVCFVFQTFLVFSPLYVKYLSVIQSAACAFHSNVPHHKANRTPLPEQNTSKEEEAEDILHSPADSRIGETFSQTEISGLRRAGISCQDAQDDRRSSQNLVPKPTHKMEVSLIFPLYCGWAEIFETLTRL
jgi:hypothetical protein